METEFQIQPKPKCPTCGGVLRYRWKTNDYVCVSGPHKFPASQFETKIEK